jgi:hypothetical protein
VPITGEPFAFEPRDVKATPDDPGVFALFARREVVYIGVAEHSLRDTLEARLATQSIGSDDEITGFVYESTEFPHDRRRDLLFEYRAITGAMPKQNGRQPTESQGITSARRARMMPEPKPAPKPAANLGPIRRPRWSDIP